MKEKSENFSEAEMEQWQRLQTVMAGFEESYDFLFDCDAVAAPGGERPGKAMLLRVEKQMDGDREACNRPSGIYRDAFCATMMPVGKKGQMPGATAKNMWRLRFESKYFFL